MASPFVRRLACSSSRIEFVSYGLLFHLQLLSTPHYCDAVTFGYRPGNFGRTGLSPANTVRSKAHERRSPDLHSNKRRRQAATIINAGGVEGNCDLRFEKLEWNPPAGIEKNHFELRISQITVGYGGIVLKPSTELQF